MAILAPRIGAGLRHVPSRNRRKRVTVGIAALFAWNYGGGTWGRAVLVASDRMITAPAANIEYEPKQAKIGAINLHTIVMISGDYTPHSEALAKTRASIAQKSGASVEEIAHIYAEHIRAIRRRHAEHTYLAPFGLDTESFLKRQRELAPAIADELSNRLLNYQIDCEAIIAGCDGIAAHIYHVDSNGLVTCQDDVSFVSIGAGASHANSQFMQAQYASHGWVYTSVLPLIYLAKKSAETAPGVGHETDLYLVTRDGVQPVAAELRDKVHAIYQTYEQEARALQKRSIDEMDKFYMEMVEKYKTTPQIADSTPNEEKKGDQSPSSATQNPASSQPTAS